MAKINYIFKNDEISYGERGNLFVVIVGLVFGKLIDRGSPGREGEGVVEVFRVNEGGGDGEEGDGFEGSYAEGTDSDV